MTKKTDTVAGYADISGHTRGAVERAFQTAIDRAEKNASIDGAEVLWDTATISTDVNYIEAGTIAEIMAKEKYTTLCVEFLTVKDV